MRVAGGADYIDYVRRALSALPPEPRSFDGYDLRFFDDPADMRAELFRLDAEVGLARLVAGFAWPWVSKSDKGAFDITVERTEGAWKLSQHHDAARRRRTVTGLRDHGSADSHAIADWMERIGPIAHRIGGAAGGERPPGRFPGALGGSEGLETFLRQR